MEDPLCIWEHADTITLRLAQAIAQFESGVGNVTLLENAISHAWQCVIEDAKQSKVSLSKEYLSSLHNQLVKSVDGDQPGIFKEGIFPQDWATFVADIYDANDGKIEGSEAWLLAQLFWGDHIQSMRFSLAWLCLDGLRLQEGKYALYPSQEYRDRLEVALKAAGPVCWDAETLRALFGEYENDQIPIENHGV